MERFLHNHKFPDSFQLADIIYDSPFLATKLLECVTYHCKLSLQSYLLTQCHKFLNILQIVWSEEDAQFHFNIPGASII